MIQEINALLDHFDGVLMTGAVSNVHPPHYGEEATEAHEPFDHGRDQTTLKLIRAVIDRGIPLVLHLPRLSGTQCGDGRHRLKPNCKVVPAGSTTVATLMIRTCAMRRCMMWLSPRAVCWSACWARGTTRVNSVHRQGIKTLGHGLEVEATAPDGIIEAVSVKGARSFAFGTQWHPEYKAAQNPDSVKLFTAFGDAVRAHQREREPGLLRSQAGGLNFQAGCSTWPGEGSERLKQEPAKPTFEQCALFVPR